MAWGLLSPSGFGDFWPLVDYVGREEALQNYFDNEMPAEEKVAYPFFSHYRSSTSRKFTDDKGPLKPHEAPKVFKADRTLNNLASLIKLNDRMIAVDQPLKDLIEQFEPGLHQFWPITIQMPKGQVCPKQFYGFRIARFLDAFRPDQSAAGSWRESLGSYAADDTKKGMSGIAFSKAEIGTSHVWREKKLIRPAIFLSDELQAAIAAAGLRLFKHYPVKEV